ncbi:MAG: GFA family protein [Caulobacteraceae bacterium]
MAEERVLEGGCLCGQVRFAARGTPENVRLCHCRSCQKAMGSPFFARALYGGGQVTLSGEVASYPSSPMLERLFCPRCGTRIGAYRAASDNTALALALFDDPDALTPDAHFFTASRIGWAARLDSLPSYEEWAPD